MRAVKGPSGGSPKEGEGGEERGGLLASVLAQRAASEGPRWTRAVGAPTGHPPVKGGKSVEGA